MKLNGKVAIITGAATGIGKAIAERFLREGASVVICDVNEEKLQQTVKELRLFGEIRGCTTNIALKNEDKELAKLVFEEFGHIDILVNNAGITRDAQFYKMTDEQFNQVIDINLKGNYYLTKEVLPYMMENNYGKIIHIASVSAFNGNFGQSNYAASKAAIMGMTRVQGKELGKYHINVNAIAPGSIMTDMYAAVPEDIKEAKLKKIPVRRYGTPDDVASLASFLASDEAAYITAQTIVIDGGFN